MGTKRQKRRKKIRRDWEEFQSVNQLSDSTMKLVRQTGFPIERFRKRLEDADLTNEESKTQLIKELHQQRTRNDLAAPDPSARHARRPSVCWHPEERLVRNHAGLNSIPNRRDFRLVR